MYFDPAKDRQHSQIEQKARLVRARIEKVQFGVWCRPEGSRGPRRSFSIEHE